MIALALQLALVSAGCVALFASVRAKNIRSRATAQALFSVLLVSSLLTQAVSAQERARARLSDKVSDMESLARTAAPAELKVDGLDLMKSSIESALELGLGRGSTVLLILAAALLGMGLRQLLVLHHRKHWSTVLSSEGAS